MKFPISYLCLEKCFLVTKQNTYTSKHGRMTVEVSTLWSIDKDIDQTIIVVHQLYAREGDGTLIICKLEKLSFRRKILL